ncbi:MAG: polysaccharide biosynthesis/export family protein [Alphaproteobacteria bacterium]
MTGGGRWAALALMLLVVGCTVSAGEDAARTAVARQDGDGLRPGARVAVTVAGQPELSATYELDADGRLEMPLLGSVDAHGLRADELADRLVAGLADGYLREPQVDVERVGVRPFFILGAVDRPGSYPYRAGMTVADAVAAAGGARDDGEVAVVLTPAGRERDARRVGLDAELGPGDIVALEAPSG